MTVKELIKKLQKYPEDHIVFINLDGFPETVDSVEELGKDEKAVMIS